MCSDIANSRTGERQIDSNLALTQLFSTTADFFELLDKETILNLTLTSKIISKVVCNFVSNHWIFDFSQLPLLKLNYYTPKKVQIKCDFKEVLDYLPYLNKMKFLTFGGGFNKPLNGLLPSTLTHLTFGYHFNKSVNSLPASLTHLTLGSNFNQPLTIGVDNPKQL
eukprot:TRINITY_DN4513_c0_g1_i4.p1 TRINITY_DN4513_c0_g1~~TRINITY_DN4513_c0_g1_i4.p1  ORF type:complete len:166 (-),score=21.10 TRINITY_DN4513_c0_g1_i4:154-651(-)